MSNPTIVCVPGAWLPPNIYSESLQILESHGYPTISLALPSVGADPGLPNFDEDVKLTKLIVEESKDVVLVMHSYSGVPGTEAPVGLGKQEREEKGEKGGVVRLVYVAALAMREGPGVWANTQLQPQSGTVTVNPSNAKRLFFNDLSDTEAAPWLQTLRPQSLGVYASRQTYAAWRHIPSTFIHGTRDCTHFSQSVVQAMIQGAREVAPSAFDVVERVDAGHCLMVSRPAWFAGALRRAAGEVVGDGEGEGEVED
ncbi:alpha/beta-hydrolase [Lophiostoma macrostomum CBS 122681]|uniref:Alpha/beta-hydrolase n=1 Tax=Lophiostoma macrostomum CBS 122681 TaxID=1314788 RepID=A0A6A6TCR7_9PLEO|nr:alpha/beta-hydrolase [Lophiostoma macrostomum CBS 122681]